MLTYNVIHHGQANETSMAVNGLSNEYLDTNGGATHADRKIIIKIFAGINFVCSAKNNEYYCGQLRRFD